MKKLLLLLCLIPNLVMADDTTLNCTSDTSGREFFVKFNERGLIIPNANDDGFYDLRVTSHTVSYRNIYKIDKSKMQYYDIYF